MAADREENAERFAALRNDSMTADYTQKVPADHPDYKTKAAEPTMEAVDRLPLDYLRCLHSYGYVDVYRAWLRRWPVARIRERAERNGGRFVL
jgi:hypothetical protein